MQIHKAPMYILPLKPDFAGDKFIISFLPSAHNPDLAICVLKKWVKIL